MSLVGLFSDRLFGHLGIDGFLSVSGENPVQISIPMTTLIGSFILPAIALGVSLSMVRRRLYIGLCVSSLCF